MCKIKLRIFLQSLNFEFILFHQTPHRTSGWSRLLKTSRFVLGPQSVSSASPPEGIPLGLWPGSRLVCTAWTCVCVCVSHTHSSQCDIFPSFLPVTERKSGAWCAEADVLWSRYSSGTGAGPDGERQPGDVPLRCQERGQEDNLRTDEAQGSLWVLNQGEQSRDVF